MIVLKFVLWYNMTVCSRGGGIMNLEEARKQINELDKTLVETFEKRLALSLEVAKYKEDSNMKIFDPGRKQEIVNQSVDRVKNEQHKAYVSSFMESVLDISKAFQKAHIKQHIFLIGMPGAGKTTVGKALAQAQGMDFYDIDAVIQEKVGKSIQNIIIHDGEPAFRQYEYDAIKEISARTPSVIATGGGTVLSAETCKLMRERGFVVFIHRDVKQILDDLDLEIRPLLKESIEYIFRLYEERYPLYEKVSNLKIQNISNISDAVEAIIAGLPNVDK